MTTNIQPENPPAEPRQALTAGSRQKSALPTNRRQSLVIIEGIEDKVRPGPWKTRIALCLLAAVTLWFLIQSVILQMVDVYFVPVTTANVESGAIVDGPKATPPFSHLIAQVQAIAAGEPGADPFAFPLTWVALLALVYGLVLLTDRRQTGLANRALEEPPTNARAEQERFFASSGALPSPADMKEDVDGDHFADDLPAHIRKALSWWNDETAPDPAILTHSLNELRTYLQDEAFYWLRACAVWPEPQWHLVLYLGRGLRNSHGESLHSFETADRLASLPWFMTNHMPMWLRRYLLGTLSKDQQQEIRYLLQALLISTARGVKTDFALELAEYHTLFMKSAGNETTQLVLKDATAGSTLRDELLQQFMAKPLEDAFYKSLKNRGSKSDDDTGVSGFARVSVAADWMSKALGTACAVALVAVLILLPVLSNLGGVWVTTRHGQGTFDILGRVKGPPARFFWVPAGIQEVKIISKDYAQGVIKVDVKGRTIVDLGAVVLRHERTGFGHPQPGDNRSETPATP